MSERIFLKMGGSFLTDKNTPDSLNEHHVRRIARGVRMALQHKNCELVLGHGAGAYGHITAHQYNARAGIHPEHGWTAFYRIRQDMIHLNSRIVHIFEDEAIHPITIQPSAILTALRSDIISIHSRVIRKLLEYGQIPMIHGDIIVDEFQGFTIASTEDILTVLAQSLTFQHVIFISDVPGVLAPGGSVIPFIDRHNKSEVIRQISGANAIDVTGGMKSKVERIWSLIEAGHIHKATIMTCDDKSGDKLAQTILEDTSNGTCIKR